MKKNVGEEPEKNQSLNKLEESRKYAYSALAISILLLLLLIILIAIRLFSY